MSIRDEIKTLFDRALHDDRNIVNGKIDWDFVDADVMMTLGVDRVVEELGFGDYAKLFTSLVEQTQ